LEAKIYLKKAEDAVTRCWWGSDHLDYRCYHDDEWGHPETSDFRLFEKICLEGFQSGLSWLTIHRKRENFRKTFVGFDFSKVAHFDEGVGEDLFVTPFWIKMHPDTAKQYQFKDN
jgi:DNA-3-methyladenine glycosylase I